MLRIGHFNVVNRVAESPFDTEPVPFRRDTGIDPQAGVIRSDTENVLADRVIAPGCGAGEPGVLGFTGNNRVLAADHLRVDIRLSLAQGDVVLVSRGGLAIV